MNGSVRWNVFLSSCILTSIPSKVELLSTICVAVITKSPACHRLYKWDKTWMVQIQLSWWSNIIVSPNLRFGRYQINIPRPRMAQGVHWAWRRSSYLAAAPSAPSQNSPMESLRTWTWKIGFSKKNDEMAIFHHLCSCGLGHIHPDPPLSPDVSGSCLARWIKSFCAKGTRFRPSSTPKSPRATIKAWDLAMMPSMLVKAWPKGLRMTSRL